jgi:hypothetical protein
MKWAGRFQWECIMSAEKGFYSIIQYCPDLWRGEAANVGVVLFQPESRQMSVKLSDTLARVKHFRYLELSDKAQQGTLTAAERGELEDYLDVDDLLMMLQAKARASLAPENSTN